MNVLDWVKANIMYICLFGCVATDVMWFWFFRERLKIRSIFAAVGLAAVCAASGVFCVYLFSSLEKGGKLLESGMSLYGLIFVLPIFLLLISKIFHIQVRDMFDASVFCLITSLMLMRYNCIRSGCCIGAYLPGSTELRYPTRELEIIFHFILLIALFHREKKSSKRVDGDLFPLYMMIYGTFRFVEEFFREGKGILHISHIWSIVSFVVGFAIYTELRKKVFKRKVQH